jgi:hypothetical protein
MADYSPGLAERYRLEREVGALDGYPELAAMLGAGDAVLLLDEANRVVYENPAMRRLLAENPEATRLRAECMGVGQLAFVAKNRARRHADHHGGSNAAGWHRALGVSAPSTSVTTKSPSWVILSARFLAWEWFEQGRNSFTHT